jgi:hypothetical protein
VQAIALIVLEPPSRADAEAAVSEAQREQNAMGLHPESAQARAARAAGIGIFPAAAGSARNASADGDSAGVAACLLLPRGYFADSTLLEIVFETVKGNLEGQPGRLPCESCCNTPDPLGRKCKQ